MRWFVVLLLLAACSSEREEAPFSDDLGPARGAIPRGSVWQYWDRGGDLGTAWRGAFDDAGWSSGAGPLGYGEAYLRTAVEDGPSSGNELVTTYFRRTFTVDDPTQLSAMVGELMYDDGAVVYLNGVEIARASMPAGPIGPDTAASGHEAGNRYQAFDWSEANGLIVPGPNLIAVEVHQASASASDLVFDLALEVETAPMCEIPSCGPAVAPARTVSLPALSVAPGAAWVAGAGTIGRKVGEGNWCWCERDPAEQITAAWAAADDDVWFVGAGGLALHHDGAAFTRVDLGTTEDLNAVWGSGPDDVWVVGRQGVVRHLDGAAWSDRSVASDEALSTVWGAATGEVWIGGTQPVVVPDDPEMNGSSAMIHRWDAAASSWTLEMKVTTLHGAAAVRDLHGTSASDVWAIGSDHPAGAACSISAAWHHDGASWTRVDMDDLDECRGFSDVEAGAPGALDGAWIAGEEDGGDPGTLRFTNDTWSVDPAPAAQDLHRIDHLGGRMFATGVTSDGGGFRHKIVRWVDDHWMVDW